MSKTKIPLKSVALLGFFASSIIYAVNLTDIQYDAQAQRVMSLYGNSCVGGVCTTIYNDGILTIPDEMVCLLNQVWKPELVGMGNVHVEVNESKCIGSEEGRPRLDAVFNLSLDSATGETVGKLWINDLASKIYVNNPDVVSYIKISVTSSPTAAEPFGRFKMDAVDALKNGGELLANFAVVASGSEFSVIGKGRDDMNAEINFSGYADGIARKGAYQLNSGAVTSLGFNDNHICFKAGGAATDCFPRLLSASATNPNIKVNAWNYGIYNTDGSRYDGSVADLYTSASGLSEVFTLIGGFGASLTNKNGGTRPGGTTVFGSDGEFWSDKAMYMGAAKTPVRVQWMTKTHSVAPAAREAFNATSHLGIVLGTTLPSFPALDPSIAKGIGEIPSAVLDTPLKVKAGKLL